MYGRKTTDHKPLETITRKPISSTPKRLQRMILELQRHRSASTTDRRRQVAFPSTHDTGLARHERRHRRNRCKLQHLPVASKRTSKGTMISNPIPTLPWQVVASVMFNFDGREYVLVVVYYSNYPEDTPARYTISHSDHQNHRSFGASREMSETGER